jgi:WD40 repeat protein
MGHEETMTALGPTSSLRLSIPQWQVRNGADKRFRSVLDPDGCYLVSAAKDRLVRIWDLETGQSVGDPLWQGDELFAVAVFTDGDLCVELSPM